MNNAQAKALLTQLYQAAVARALPALNTAAYLPAPPNPSKGRTVVIGAGKAGGAMAHAVEQLWPQDAPMRGIVITRYNHEPPRPVDMSHRIEVVHAAHPVPDAAGLQAAQRILDSVKGLTADDLVLCLISGGGSSLLSLPCEGLSFANKQSINQALLRSGANIAEMNCVRKHLSAIKGGRLAAACSPARVVTLLISDVPGDEPAVIASGPTVPDPSTCTDALAIIERYQIDIPNPVRAALLNGALETPKPNDPRFAGHSVHTIATPRLSLLAAADKARELGITPHILGDDIEGESREVAKVHASIARSSAAHGQPFEKPVNTPCVILSGGETTVTVKDKTGRGGRAGEFCLSLAQSLQGAANIYALAADTDGIDGIEDNAGAFVMPDTLTRATTLGLSAQHHADHNDSYTFFKDLDDLFVTGPTHTNVNDFRAILLA
jgi:hydroxypyruvate reductase